MLPKLFWPTVRKIVLVIEKKLNKIFEINRTIYSNSERSEQFFVTKCFFKLFQEVSHVSKMRTIRIQIGKRYWDLETCRKSSFEKISEKVSITFYFILLFSVNFFSMHGGKIQNVTLHCMHDSLLCRKHVWFYYFPKMPTA